MVRLHRSVKRRVGKIDSHSVANAAEEYVEAARLYARDLKGLTGLCSLVRMKAMIKKIDAFDREIVKLENKIETLLTRQGLEAVKLEDELKYNMQAVRDWLPPEEFKDFVG